MTKKLFTLLVLIVASISSFSQNVKEQELLDSEVYYMISDTRIAKDSAEAKFVRLYNRIDSVYYNVEEFYMNKKPKLVAKTSVYSVDFRKGLQGYCMEYYNNGKRKSIKNYEKGQLVGEAIEYYPNGVVYNITDNDKNGIYLKSFSDSTGKVLTENGNGFGKKLNLTEAIELYWKEILLTEKKMAFGKSTFLILRLQLFIKREKSFQGKNI
ncbi:hypothetical protein ACFQZI_20515 [Mucilaginibacter lutimaris]|uniref:MORN repeat variant n=1 Tax=Mucilaginibacter lutimaris TaxID=931629 RepID=A0ABW2ZMA3_9SPHI